jgi:transposase-like protein
MDLFIQPCPVCNSNEIKYHGRYSTINNGFRSIFHCPLYSIYYSETFATPIASLRTLISRIAQILKARTDEMGLNATARTFNVSKKSVIDWEHRLSDHKL